MRKIEIEENPVQLLDVKNGIRLILSKVQYGGICSQLECCWWYYCVSVFGALLEILLGESVFLFPWDFC